MTVADKDLQAAFKAYYSELQSGPAKLPPDELRKLLGGFIKYFQIWYKATRAQLQNLKSKREFSEFIVNRSAKLETKSPMGSYDVTGKFVAHKEYHLQKPKGFAAMMGEFLGYLLCLLEYGVASEMFDLSYSDAVYGNYNKLTGLMKSHGQRLKRSFIERRLRKIAARKGKSISDHHYRLLNKIADLFK